MSLICRRLRFSRLTATFLLVGMPLTHDVLAAGSGQEESDMHPKKSERPVSPQVGLSDSQSEGFNQALKRSSEFFTLTDRGDSLLAEGKFQEAITEYKKAMGKAKLQADALYVHDRLAKAYEQTERYEEALQEVREIARLWPHEETKEKVLKRIRDLEEKAKAQGGS